MEQTLGQITHTQNFRHWVAQDSTVEPVWILIPYGTDRRGSIPVIGKNWTVRASLEARRRVREVLRKQRLDALFLHTQVTTLFAHRLMATIPTVVSMDATPLDFDTVGGPYGHRPSGIPMVETLKNALMRRSFRAARQLIIWHDAGKNSLVRAYRVPPEKVVVIPPGIDMERWNFARRADRPGPVRLLFVGGDFQRKGGDTLLAAFRAHLMPHCELDIVTRDPVDTTGLENVRVHNGLRPNVPELLDLYARADIFVFPTFADMLPLAIMEALAAGLPVITTDVGAIREEVDDGVTGLLVPPGDAQALAEAALRLIRDPTRRSEMSTAARDAARRRFNGARNYPAILEVCKRCADAARPAATVC